MDEHTPSDSSGETLAGQPELALKILVGDRKDDVVPVHGELLIGRSPECNLRVGDPRVSRRHVLLMNPEGQLHLRDLDSQNGTWVNSTRVDHIKLRNGDHIRIGSVRFQVVPAQRRRSALELVDGGTGSMRVSRFDPRTISRGTSLPIEPSSLNSDDEAQRQRREEVLARLRNYAAVVDLSQRIQSEPDVQTMLRDVLGELVTMLQADRGIVALVEDAPDALRPEVVVYRDGSTPEGIISLSRTITRQVMEARCGVITHVSTDLPTSVSLLASSMRTLLAVPLQAGARALGMIEISSLSPDGRFTEMDLELVQVVASTLGPELHQRELAAEQERTIARLKEAQRQLAKLDELKRRARRADGLTRQVKKTAHEMNNQLLTLNSIGLLKEFSTASGEATAYVEQLEVSAKRLAELLGQLVDEVDNTARQHRRRPGSLAEVARSAERSMRFVPALKNHRLDLVIVDDPFVVLDQGAIRDVVINLLRNAGQAIDHDQGHIVLRVEKCDGYGTLQVVDNGPGIPADLLEHIFEEHVTTKEDGMGVGLAIARATVERHGGELTVHTKVGSGTTFTVQLPLALTAPPSRSGGPIELSETSEFDDDDPTGCHPIPGLD